MEPERRGPAPRKDFKPRNQGRCPSCGNWQYVEARAWHAKTKPMCRACGAALEPSVQAQYEDRSLSTAAPDRRTERCQRCNARLSMSNYSKFCRPCQAVLHTRRVL